MGLVVWTEPALADVQEIMHFVAKDSRRYALKLADRMMEATRGLANQPLSGGRVPEFDQNDLREVLVRPYRIIYNTRGADSYVVAVIHGARDLPSTLGLPGNH
jgi:plasmid stabilization system protein ParE